MKKSTKDIIRIAVAIVLGIVAGFLNESYTVAKLILFSAAYLISGYKVLYKAITNIFHGEIFDENFLMCIASIGAFALGDYRESVFVMVFYNIGEMFEDYAVNRSRNSIKNLVDLKINTCFKKQGNKRVEVKPEELKVGDIIVVNPGEKVAVDSVVVKGESNLNISHLNGESIPKAVGVGSEVLSGSINLLGVLELEVKKTYENSAVSVILNMVENAAVRKSKSEKFITKFAKYYTPAVVISAVVLAFVPPLFLGFSATFFDWFKRALTFLVISCPCALVISVPLAYFGGIAGASSLGILIKGGNYLENLTKVKSVCFDKTGTLTKGVFKVTEVKAVSGKEEELIKLAAIAEMHSTHPIAKAIVDESKIDKSKEYNAEIKELAGLGIEAKIDNDIVLAGNIKLMEQNNINISVMPKNCKTVVFVAKNNEFCGYIAIDDEIKPEAEKVIEQLTAKGINTYMLTGDNEESAKAVANRLKLTGYRSELTPKGKMEFIEDIKKKHNKNEKIAFLGDGINDAPVLSLADVGISMGSIGSDSAVEASDIVIMDDNLKGLIRAFKVSGNTNKIAKENIYFALTVKAVVLILGALGLANMWLAVFADVGVSVIAIINSLRVLNTKKIK